MIDREDRLRIASHEMSPCVVGPPSRADRRSRSVSTELWLGAAAGGIVVGCPVLDAAEEIVEAGTADGHGQD